MWLLTSALLCAVVTVVGALDALAGARLVTVVVVVGGAFGSGAALTSAVYTFRRTEDASGDRG